jgi:gamma-glutamyltranspeptidase
MQVMVQVLLCWVFLNNEMDDFSAKGWVPNMFGLVGSKTNSIAPPKDAEFHDTNHCRKKERKAFMTVGSPGVRRLLLQCCKR